LDAKLGLEAVRRGEDVMKRKAAFENGRARWLLLCWVIVVLLGLGASQFMQAQMSEKILHTFSGGSDGGNPFGGLIADAQGNLYGTTQVGGAYGYGTVFMLDTSQNETVLYSFTGGSDGASPLGGLLEDTAGNFYGTTELGGFESFPKVMG
jgi:uncharacterized repeat protein (TIGR03803 family)